MFSLLPWLFEKTLFHFQDSFVVFFISTMPSIQQYRKQNINAYIIFSLQFQIQLFIMDLTQITTEIKRAEAAITSVMNAAEKNSTS